MRISSMIVIGWFLMFVLTALLWFFTMPIWDISLIVIGTLVWLIGTTFTFASANKSIKNNK